MKPSTSLLWLALAGVVAFASGPAAAQTKWNLPAAYPADNPHSENLAAFAKDVAEATGGDTSAISTTSTTNMPNQMTSKPALLIIGITTAVVSTIIEMPSSAVPSTIYITVSAAISA